MKRALSLAYLALSLAALASGAERCGQVADCVIDVGRACAKEHLPLRIERAAAAKVVAARNAHDVDRDGCYRETEITDYPDAVWLPAGAHMKGVLAYLECVEAAEAAEDMSRHATSSPRTTTRPRGSCTRARRGRRPRHL